DDLIKKSGKKIVFDLVKNENLSNDQLVTIAKHTSGNDMSDEPEVGAKLLVAMIKNSTQGSGSSVSVDAIKKYIEQVDKNHSIFQSHNKDTMKSVISQLGDGPDSDYAKFQKLAPSTLDRMGRMAE
ncbi:MAG: hypothetical protein H7263_12610, partial [Candidatus Sericytochromatia bacterium]|nr:hypothetical protein [Candidatus Sericytochromatia bacterium]